MKRRAHQQAVALLDKTADRVHVPDVILVGMYTAFRQSHETGSYIAQ
jgi:hypothetical protein